MTQTLEERKQEFREELKQASATFKKPVFSWQSKSDMGYLSTWLIANTPPYYQSTQEVFIARNNPGSILEGIFIFFFVFCMVVFAKAYENNLAMCFLSIPVWIGIKAIIKGLDKKPKLTIDSHGILYHEWFGYIGWKDIISTYMLEKDDGEHTTTNLLIYFYDTEDDMIKQKLVSLDGWKTDIVELSFFIEYIKMKAGFPTNPSHY
ncbi:MAG: hypothetical protein ACTHMM_01080 [Agriterribacter sp.]